MKQVNKKVLRIVERVVKHEVEKKSSSWICMGIFHQPKRPLVQQEK